MIAPRRSCHCPVQRRRQRLVPPPEVAAADRALRWRPAGRDARLVSFGRTNGNQALVVLQKAEKEHPEDAAVAADLAQPGRWSTNAGPRAPSKAARMAGQHDPKWRGDERLVKNLIRALGSDKGYERRTEDVLHGFGPPAIPYLKTAAAHDKNPVVRERAAELLRERRTRAPRAVERCSRPPPPPTRKSSSSHSIFTR